MAEVIDKTPVSETTTPVSEATQQADEKQKSILKKWIDKEHDTKKKQHMQKKERSEAIEKIRSFESKCNGTNYENNSKVAILLNKKKNLEGKRNRVETQLAKINKALCDLSLKDTECINEARQYVGSWRNTADAYHEIKTHKPLKCMCARHIGMINSPSKCFKCALGELKLEDDK